MSVIQLDEMKDVSYLRVCDNVCDRAFMTMTRKLTIKKTAEHQFTNKKQSVYLQVQIARLIGHSYVYLLRPPKCDYKALQKTVVSSLL